MEVLYIVILMIALPLAVIALQIFLSLRRNKWFGMIPWVAAVIIIGSLGVWLSHTGFQYSKQELSYVNRDGYRYQMIVRYDKKDQLVDTIDLQFDSQGKLESADYLRIHQKDISQLVKDHRLNGYSTSWEMIDENWMKTRDGTYTSINSFAAVIIIYATPLLILHLIIRAIVKRKYRNRETKKLKVDSL